MYNACLENLKQAAVPSSYYDETNNFSRSHVSITSDGTAMADNKIRIVKPYHALSKSLSYKIP